MELTMDWMKILNKGLDYGKKIIVVVIVIFIVAWAVNKSGDKSELSIKEDINDLRSYVDKLDEQNRITGELVTNVIDTNTRLIGTTKELERENRETRNIISELSKDNRAEQSTTRLIQDGTLESELIVEDLERIINQVERENNYSRKKE